MIFRKIALFLFLLFSFNLSAQIFKQEEKGIHLRAANNSFGFRQFSNSFEVGFGIYTLKSNGCAFSYSSKSIFGSFSYNPFQKINGFHFGGCANTFGMLETELTLNLFTQGKNNSVGMQPAIGFGNGFLAVLFGYNIRFGDNLIDPIPKASLTIRYNFSIYKKDVIKSSGYN